MLSRSKGLKAKVPKIWKFERQKDFLFNFIIIIIENN